jgi:proteasome lid subunit RPN8/RPN11
MSTGKSRLSERVERANPVVPVHVWKSPPGAAVDLIIVTGLDVYSAIHNHSVCSLPHETGGFLLGRVGFDAGADCWHIEIDQAVPITPLENDPVHFSFGWQDVDRIRRQREEQGKAVVGWYHTHPDMGIFLSETDLERTHRVLFSEPFQIALVYDPVRGRAGYFFWEGLQQIDSSEADWREFQIAVEDEQAERSGLDGSENQLGQD